jgi:pimeloyl-ACP methyl ester carboxylesterase
MTSRCRSLAGLAPLVALALLAASAAKVAAQAALPRFEPADCLVQGEWAANVRRECGWLVVPESRDHPSPNTVRLAVEVFRAREPSGAPPLLVLHGGPGGRGGIRTMSAGVAASPFVRHRDVVIYDQRGAGLSEPQLCPAYETASEAAYNVRNGPDKEGALRAARGACVAELDAKGIDRLAYNTAASAADLIDLRRTLGYASWDVYGGSYGARLAQEAMVRDGSAIRAVVLASPVARGFAMAPEQPLSTQRAFERLFAACARQPSCRRAFPHVEQDFYAAHEALTRSPVPVSSSGPQRPTGTVWVDGDRLVADIRDRLGPRMEMGRAPLLLHELRFGDRLRAAREIVGDGSVPMGFAGRAVRALINCYDSYGPEYRRTLQRVNSRARAPFRRVVNRECEDWLPRFAEPPARTPVKSDIPTLILTGHFDDRTPTEHARRIAATLRRSYLVEFPDEGHDVRPGDCHLKVIAQFLDDPTRKPDTSCVATLPPLPFATTWEATKPR